MPQGMILLDGLSGFAKVRRRMVRTQAFDGAQKYGEACSKRCQAWNSGERIADVPHPPHYWQMDAIFFPVATSAYSAMICVLSSFLLPHHFLTHVDTIVLFFLSEKSKEYLS
jgi:hypothetical protein